METYTPEQLAEFGYDPTVPRGLFYRHCVSGGVELAAHVGLVGNGSGGPGHETHPIGADAAPADPLDLRARARARLDPPVPVPAMAPSGTDDVPAIVRVPTWLWLPPAYWAGRSETEQDGAVGVRVEAQPRQVVWSMGDRQEQRCDGPGTVWSPGMPESASSCKHEYRVDSSLEPDGRFHGTVSVVWEFSWWLNGAAQGVFGTTSTPPAPFSLAVEEVQVVNVSPAVAARPSIGTP